MRIDVNRLLRYSIMFLALLPVACTSNGLPEQVTTSAPITSTDTPTQTPSATATETETPSPTPEPTPAGDLIFDFQNKGQVLPVGARGEFDGWAVWAPDVIYYENTFHMFYTAFNNRTYNNSTIGYASSPDGINWTKYDGNPILTGTGDFPKLQSPAVMVDAGQWVMLLDGGRNGTPLNQFMLRATAPSPTGPWRLDPEPVFRGRTLNWDYLNQPVTIQKIEDTYYLFYSGVGGPAPQMGLAVSQDGMTWEPYNDPTTNDPPLTYSDPILQVGPEGSWDQGGLASYEVMYTDGKWEMFYVGFPEDPFERASQDYEQPLQIGYATSQNAILWEKYVGNPVFSSGERRWPLLDSIHLPDGRYYLYFDIDGGPGGLALMEGTIRQRP